jgi:NADH-quinone oxidoreductase subunit E
MSNCLIEDENKGIREIIARFQGVNGGLIPALQSIDAEYRAIPEEAIVDLSKMLEIPVSKVFGVATFYAKFRIGKRGKNIIRFCKSAPCHISGAAEVIAALEKELDIKVGETTEDRKFTLEMTECVGWCNCGPIFTINEQPYFNITAEKIPEILAQF